MIQFAARRLRKQLTAPATEHRQRNVLKSTQDPVKRPKDPRARSRSSDRRSPRPPRALDRGAGQPSHCPQSCQAVLTSPRRVHAEKMDEGLSRRPPPPRCAGRSCQRGQHRLLPSPCATPLAGPAAPWKVSVHQPARTASRGAGVAVVGTAPARPRPGFPTGGYSRRPGPDPVTHSVELGTCGHSSRGHSETKKDTGSWLLVQTSDHPHSFQL